MHNKFGGLLEISNFLTHQAGQILTSWNVMKVNLEVLETTLQVIRCTATCNISLLTFLVSFVYAFYTIVSRRSLWNNIMEFVLNCSLSWSIMGDFNNIYKFDEKCNGTEVTPYNVKDFENCCLSVGLTNVRSIGCFYTWTNSSIWSKLDRAMENDIWVQAGFNSLADFLPRDAFSITHHALSHFLVKRGARVNHLGSSIGGLIMKTFMN